MKEIFGFIFKIFIINLLLSKIYSKSAISKTDKVWKNKKANCQKTTCSRLITEESYNCVNNCTSNYCYNEIYSSMPLEDGEIDHIRDRQFISCARKEVQTNNKKLKTSETISI